MELDNLFGPESPPIGNGVRRNVHSPPRTYSFPCGTYLHGQENDHYEESRETSSAATVMTHVFFPLTPDLKGFSVTEDPRNTCREIFAAQPKQKSEGVSTKLMLCHDPYKIKKKLTRSDIERHQSRLLICRDIVTSHLVGWMNEDIMKQVESKDGAEVTVWDMDESHAYQLVFGFWKSSRAYIFKGGWIDDFVNRRQLAVGDEIGMYWDRITNSFRFSLLRKA